ncbi:MAG: Glycine betaine/carnitine/choline transport ATP-binding protein OpuCA [Candidatus Anoxychlamydiales bacterium]|nr:Glycine betaine/carnitine/choline transport ATP-binding protein OpuCA [Candidatus Anoxychlamydiales bacterium]
MIKFEKVTKIFKKNIVSVKDVSFEVKKGETLVLLGTSGCGKTTTMRMINRLIDPTSGNILINNENIKNFNPINLRRNIGYAIQSIGLFNYMSVYENIAIVLNLLKWKEDKIKKRVFYLLDLMGFDPIKYHKRYPKELSGGEKQRIGVARAIASDPDIILMDEPFGALDPIIREQIQNDFLKLESYIKKTVIFVTHDVFEAVKMADKIALMDKGEIIQIDTPYNLIENPKNEFVKQFFKEHKFQLSLKTNVIDNLISQNKNFPEDKKNYLVSKSSIIDALDKFKKSKKNILPVYDNNKLIGSLEKNKLLNSIFEIL